MNYQNFFQDLKKLISFKSVQSSPSPNAPFGEENKKALEFFLSLAESFGFQTVNYDNYGGEIVVGDGEEIGIVGHLDVVPASNGWDTDPFTLTEKDGKVIGRGVEDDKAPSLLILYALKNVKQSGVKFNKKIRFIVGCNEESGWKDVEYIKTKTTLPKFGFSPDSEFSLSYAEKGVYHVTISLNAFKNFFDLRGGTAVNAVCDYASVRVKDDAIDHQLLEKYSLKLNKGLIESFGVASHGSAPEKGKNALYAIFRYMEEMGEDLNGFADLVFKDGIEVSRFSTEQGKTTFSPNLIKQTETGYQLICDCRLPAPLKIAQILPCFDKIGKDYHVKECHEPFMVDKDGWFARCLLDAYNEVTGEIAVPYHSSGSTFARVFEKGFAFGPGDEAKTGGCHSTNEFITKEHLLKCYKIYEKAILNLIK